MRRSACALMILFAAVSVSAAEESETERLFMQGTDIQGSLDKPHVVYIVPWRENPGLTPEQLTYERSFMAEILEPVDRDRFYRKHQGGRGEQ